MFIKNSKFYALFFLFICFLLLFATKNIFAATTCPQPSCGSGSLARINAGQTRYSVYLKNRNNIADPWDDDCWSVKNNSGHDLLIPMRTYAEWQAFCNSGLVSCCKVQHGTWGAWSTNPPCGGTPGNCRKIYNRTCNATCGGMCKTYPPDCTGSSKVVPCNGSQYVWTTGIWSSCHSDGSGDCEKTRTVSCAGPIYDPSTCQERVNKCYASTRPADSVSCGYTIFAFVGCYCAPEATQGFISCTSQKVCSYQAGYPNCGYPCTCDGGGGDDSCFIAEAEVKMSDGTIKKISDVKIGDMVISGDNNAYPVVDIFKTTVGGRKIYSINDGHYFVTDEDLFLSKEGWKSFNPKATNKENPFLEVQELQIGDIIKNVGGGETKIESVDSIKLPSETPLYALGLQGTSTYNVNNFIVRSVSQKISLSMPQKNIITIVKDFVKNLFSD